MAEPFAMMHRKNFRIIHANKETMKNDNFIGITKKQFDRVNKDKSYGLVILKEEEQEKRRSDYAEAAAYIAAHSMSSEDDIPMSLQIDSEYQPEVEEKDLEVEEKDIKDMTIQELRKVAKELGITLHTTNSRADIVAKISEKMESEDESTVQ